MKSKNGFTLIELMVVVLIVAVLAAVLVPLLTARLESARWSEAKAGIGTIATALRALYAEQGDDYVATSTILEYVNTADMLGKYFQISDYSFFGGPTVVTDPGPTEYPITYIIRATAPSAASPDGKNYDWSVPWWQMNQAGIWTKGATTTP